MGKPSSKPLVPNLGVLLDVRLLLEEQVAAGLGGPLSRLPIAPVAGPGGPARGYSCPSHFPFGPLRYSVRVAALRDHPETSAAPECNATGCAILVHPRYTAAVQVHWLPVSFQAQFEVLGIPSKVAVSGGLTDGQKKDLAI